VLRLDDPLSRWLPHTLDTPLAAVTVRELLSHGGGVVRDGWDSDFWQLGAPFPDRDGLLAASVDDPAVLPRNDRFKYSNVGYSLLGLVVEAAGRLPYHRFVVDNVLAPLGLHDTGPEWDPDRAGEYATGYSALGYADRRVPIDHVDTRAMAAATGFWSTASDTVRLAAGMWFGDRRLLGEESKRMMQRSEWLVEGAGGDYGLGLAIQDIGGRRVFGHGGGYPGHITRTWFDPADRVAVSVFTNAIDGPALTLASGFVRVLGLAQRGIEGGANVAPLAPPRADLARFRGRYANLWGVFDIVDLAGRLYLVDPLAEDPTATIGHLAVVDDDTLLLVRSPTGYGSQGEPYRFARGADGTVLTVRAGGSTSLPLDRFHAWIGTVDRIRRPAAG
jgi:CubicO group peptidase (beta-lactamase class C family)